MKNLILFIFLSVALVSCEDMINGAITPVQVGSPSGSNDTNNNIGIEDVPDRSLEFIELNFPDEKIISITSNPSGGFIITLSDGTIINFGPGGQVIRITEGSGGNNEGGNNDEGGDIEGDDVDSEDTTGGNLPENITDFIAENFPADISSFNFKDGFYTIKLDNGWIVVFDEEGNLISVDD